MTELKADINIAAEKFNNFTDLHQWVDTAFNILAKQSGLKKMPHGEVGLLLTSDVEVQKLNREFRGQDKPTNVLSFPNEDDALFTDDENLPYLGDIAMAYETLTSEAATQNKPISEHFVHLLLHSLLHLLGYTHINDNDADEMENLEIKLLALVGIKNPYRFNGNEN